MQDEILKLAYEVSRVTAEKLGLIDGVVRQTRLLSLNARIEAARAGAAGTPFSIVAHEMEHLSRDIGNTAAELRSAIEANTNRLQSAGADLIEAFRGERFADLARSAVEIIDRNLYERSCDVRWWATDSALVEVLTTPGMALEETAGRRLATILASYTVYLDLWVANADGVIVATGRPDRFPQVAGACVRGQPWFEAALRTPSGREFAVSDISTAALLGGEQVATYSTAIRGGGLADGPAIGALGIFFDWRPQAETVVRSVGASAAERSVPSVMILDASHRVIASSDGRGALVEQFPLRTDGRKRGYYRSGDRLIAFAETPGYETYRGLGWYGVIEWKERSSPAGADGDAGPSDASHPHSSASAYAA